MNVDDPAPKVGRYQRRDSLQVSGQRDQLHRVTLQKVEQLGAIVRGIENFDGNSVLPRAIEGPRPFTIGRYDGNLSFRFTIACETFENCLEVGATTRCENSDARLHAAILLLSNEVRKTRVSRHRS
jgi:hypothetical protein